MKIYGHCRFSWFGISDTGREIETIERAHETIWHPQRIAQRFWIFENLMLPSMKGQTDQDFKLVFTVSEDMPELYLDRLARSLDGWAPGVINATSSRNIGHAIKPYMREASDGFTVPSTHFRIDDDDALNVAYIARLREEIGVQRPGTMISFPKGIIGRVDHTGQTVQVDRYHTYMAIGLALVEPETRTRNVFQIAHRLHAKRVPSYMDPHFDAYFQTNHIVNNTKGYGVDAALPNPKFTVAHLAATDPDLEPGMHATPETSERINAMFPFTTSLEISKMLQRLLKPEDLVEEMGFSDLLPKA